jgi:deoxyribose-phosphate aldolase
MGIQNKLADGIDEVDIIIAGGTQCGGRIWQRSPELTEVLQVALQAALSPVVLQSLTLTYLYW